ncbi:MAG TPA: hypothetical protein VMT24_04545 [Aggregatilineaceae bacterium]|jgi:hypothetical protein|nr:hypothetical protein [Aggregatilineaceae bacterium]
MSGLFGTANPVQKHRREVLLRIVAPVVLPFAGLILLCVVLALAVATGALVGKQITVVMSLVATVFIALPMTILCLVPYFLLAVSAHLSGRVYARARTPLRSARRLTEQVAHTTERDVPKLARPLIGLNTRLTRWEHALRGWQQSAMPAEKEANHE